MYSILRHFSASHTLSLSLSFSLFLRFQLQCRALINGSAKIGKVNLDREEEDSEWTDNRFTLDDCLVDHFLISSRSSKHTERESEHTWTHHLHLCRVAVLCSASVHQHERGQYVTTAVYCRCRHRVCSYLCWQSFPPPPPPPPVCPFTCDLQSSERSLQSEGCTSVEWSCCCRSRQVFAVSAGHQWSMRQDTQQTQTHTAN